MELKRLKKSEVAELISRIIAPAKTDSGNWLEVDTAPARQARLRISNGEARGLRGWLLLARLPLMLPSSQEKQEILARQGRGQSTA